MRPYGTTVIPGLTRNPLWEVGLCGKILINLRSAWGVPGQARNDEGSGAKTKEGGVAAGGVDDEKKGQKKGRTLCAPTVFVKIIQEVEG